MILIRFMSLQVELPVEQFKPKSLLLKYKSSMPGMLVTICMFGLPELSNLPGVWRFKAVAVVVIGVAKVVKVVAKVVVAKVFFTKVVAKVIAKVIAQARARALTQLVPKVSLVKSKFKFKFKFLLPMRKKD